MPSGESSINIITNNQTTLEFFSFGILRPSASINPPTGFFLSFHFYFSFSLASHFSPYIQYPVFLVSTQAEQETGLPTTVLETPPHTHPRWKAGPF